MERTELRNQPAYTVAEAARYLKVPAPTLRSWVIPRLRSQRAGSAQSDVLINLPQNAPAMLSFWNLIECHVLRSLRTQHGVPMGKLRKAVRCAEQEFKVKRLLLSPELRTEAGALLIERYGQLVDLSASGQLAIRRMFKEHLNRVEWDENAFPVRLFASTRGSVSNSDVRTVAISADVAFGRPVLVNGSITTAAIAKRIDAGETIDELADDYDLSPQDIESAVLFEHVA